MILVGLSVWHTALHLAWMRADTNPTLDADAYFVGPTLVTSWTRWHERWALPSLAVHPPLLDFFTTATFALEGPSFQALRHAQLPFTFALVLGTGILAWRTWGHGAAVAAAGLAVCVPTLQMQWSTLMRMGPAAGMGALALAAALDVRGARPLQAVVGGVLLAGAALSHGSFLYFAAALVAVVCLQALAALLGDRARPLRERLPPLAARLLLWGGTAALLSGLWYVPARHILGGMLAYHDQNFEAGLGLWGHLDHVARLKHDFLPPQLAWAVGLGLPLLLLALPWRPMAQVVAGVSALGFVGLLTFPQAHARYYLLLLPLLVCTAVAPLGILAWPGRLGAPRQWLALLLGLGVAWEGIRWSEASFEPGAPRAAEAPATGLRSAEAVWKSLITQPRSRRWSGVAPHRRAWGCDEVLSRIQADGGATSVGHRHTVYLFDDRINKTGLELENATTGQYALDVQVGRGDTVHHGGPLACPEPPCYAVVDPDATPDPRLAAGGYLDLATIDLGIDENGKAASTRLLRTETVTRGAAGNEGVRGRSGLPVVEGDPPEVAQRPERVAADPHAGARGVGPVHRDLGDAEPESAGDQQDLCVEGPLIEGLSGEDRLGDRPPEQLEAARDVREATPGQPREGPAGEGAGPGLEAGDAGPGDATGADGEVGSGSSGGRG